MIALADAMAVQRAAPIRYDRIVTTEPASRADSLDREFTEGGDTALKAAYELHGSLIYAICRRALPPERAAEVTQDVFISAWKGRHQFDPTRGTLAGWLIGITRRRIIDHLRSERRHTDRRADRRTDRRTDRRGEEPTGIPAEARIEKVADEIVVADALRSLPERPRQVIEMAFLNDLTHHEIAERTGLPLGTVKSDIRRGLLRIRELLESSHG
jgi:RNA polymerase sigma factor (sigma-70 family)